MTALRLVIMDNHAASGKNQATEGEPHGLNLKMDGWNTIVFFWDGLFSGAMSVSGSVFPIENRDFPVSC